jgi:hypothetical protein
MSKAKPSSFSKLAGLLRLGAALVGEIDIGPAGEAVFLVPGGFAMAKQHKFFMISVMGMPEDGGPRMADRKVFYNISRCHLNRPPNQVDIIADLIDKQEHIETAARALKAISHPLRLKILCVIGDQEDLRAGNRRRGRHLAEQHFPASGDSARQRGAAHAQGCQPGLLPRRRPAHAAAHRA